MSVFAGVVSRKLGMRVPTEWREALMRTISRRPDDERSVLADERSFFVKVDIGGLLAPASRQAASGTVAMLVGEPLLSGIEQGKGANRERDLQVLHEAWDGGDWDVLKRVRGIFAAVYYDLRTGNVCLIGDKLGLRPIYYWSNDSWIVFSTAMRILEEMPFVPKVMNFRAVTEVTCFGFPLAARTVYNDIWTIKAAEVACFEGTSFTSRQYFQWDAIPVSQKPESELLQEAHKRFVDAVRVRLHGDRVVTSFLSGGLDSRCVVGALQGQTDKLHTLNCSFPNTQDRVFGAQYARQMGTLHQEEEMMISHPDFFQHVSDFWKTDPNRKRWLPERPRLIWSGDGGSVGMGHVYMTPGMVELMRRGDQQGAIGEFLRAENKHIVRRLLKPEALSAAEEILEQGMREELEVMHREDPGRNLYLFLLLNDQRRHLANQYERIDLSHIDYVEPFFDSEFLAFIFSVPLDLCLGHRFYNKWLKLFPPPVSSVPWQSYPGHEPCPLPQPEGLISQWKNGELDALQGQFKQKLLVDSKNVLVGENFPADLLDKSYLRMARLAYRWNLRDYSYVLEAALVYNRIWGNCQGKFVLQ